MNDSSRKFPENLENPFDNYILLYGTKLFPLFKSLKFTPNIITTFSLVFGLLSCYFLYRQNFTISCIFYFLSYTFDCLDGNFARKYNMTSKFGDYYDHIKDVIVLLLLGLVYYKYSHFKKFKLENKFLIFFVTIFLLITICLHLGCQEIYVKKNSESLNSQSIDSQSLNILTNICSKKIYENMHILRYFGCGTFNIWILFLIIINKVYFHYK